MNPDDWIVVPNWDKFQHYSDRRPTWIKVYTELSSRDEWCRLTAAQRGLLVTIWIEYANSIGRTKVERVLDQIPNKGLTKSLEALNHAGFIEVSASKPLAQRRSKRRPPISPTNKAVEKTGDRRKVTGWKLVRGSHGVTHIPDPFGIDSPPAGART